MKYNYFSWKLRLHLLREFQKVFKQSKRLTCSYYQAYFQKNELNHARLGIVISKRYVRKAVDRNRLKRLIREKFRLHRAQLDSLDLIISVKQMIEKIDNQEHFQCLEELFTQCKKSF